MSEDIQHEIFNAFTICNTLQATLAPTPGHSSSESITLIKCKLDTMARLLARDFSNVHATISTLKDVLVKDRDSETISTVETPGSYNLIGEPEQ